MNGNIGATTTVKIEQQPLLISDYGPINPLPMLGAPLESPYKITADVPRDILEGSAYGYPGNLYPYQLQDGYSRTRPERHLQTVVLENEKLRAVFLPELGGRLWELVDKSTGKNLLYTPSTIQFANLALRNAWFAGGIEWNIGTRGHSPTTCSPLHAGILTTTDGQEVLRMWEFERLREVVFQIDAWLPPGSPVLYVAVRIRNPNDADVPMYWWSNAAVPEDSGNRVIAPAESAFASSYTDGISRVNPTKDGGIDCTWPVNNPRARDFFFDIAPDKEPWILQADRDGDGVAMLSTNALRGRKLFVWGQGPGGRQWQEWLSPDGGRYAEIQAGLAQTQFQHLVMPGRAEWSWVEAYGNARLDPAIAHAADWTAAVDHAGDRVEALQDAETLRTALKAAAGWAHHPPQRMVTTGSGWGAIEAVRRRKSGITWLDESGTPFAKESITEAEQPWLDLLEGQTFSGADTFIKGADWGDLLERCLSNAQASLHRAFVKHANGELDEARTLYLESLKLQETAQAYRGLALVDLSQQHVGEGLGQYVTACALEPENTALLIEALTAFLRAGRGEAALDLLAWASMADADSGRLGFLKAAALAQVGRTEEAAALLKAGVEVADLREAENSISDLWRQVCPGVDVPAQYQFSMTSEGPEE
jgi:tetratricopeptide (TPR) repeat protein